MTEPSRRPAFLTRFTLLASLLLLLPASANAKSYIKCFSGWTAGYDKSANTAFQKAVTAWTSKARSRLGTSNASWANAHNRKKNVKKVRHDGKPKIRVSVYGKYCKNNTPLRSSPRSSDNLLRYKYRASNPAN